MQLAFNRIKVPWQDAQVLSVHGRSPQALIQALQQRHGKIAVLTDPTHTPRAIAQLLLTLDLSQAYHCWVCENLGGPDEHLQCFSPVELAAHSAADLVPLNVVVLLGVESGAIPPPDELPLLGLPDPYFLNFPDQPGLISKREIRTLILAELALQPQQVVWDVGAGTGSVAIEVARLVPTAQVYAIEKTAIGVTLIQQNCQRFQVNNVTVCPGEAPAALQLLPDPDRIFIGGSGGNLPSMLAIAPQRLKPQGVIVLALATLEHLHQALTWFQSSELSLAGWQQRLLQVQIARAIPLAALTRWSPLNPVTLLTITAPSGEGTGDGRKLL